MEGSNKVAEKQTEDKKQTLIKIESLEPLLVSMVVALPSSFMPDGEQPYHDEEQEESSSLVVVEMLLTDKREDVEISTPIAANEIEGSVQIIEGSNMADKVVLTKCNTKMAYHLWPLFLEGHLNGVLVARMMVQNG
ncbi:hypothetical protein ACH5RR_029857 [Cinchona calisaya]|uniref:Uncharacterized protein n=1 Tax=Cinchona calisaya TaxID=153742 RepID=A0ABD2YSV3_9GENT